MKSLTSYLFIKAADCHGCCLNNTEGMFNIQIKYLAADFPKQDQVSLILFSHNYKVFYARMGCSSFKVKHICSDLLVPFWEFIHIFFNSALLFIIDLFEGVFTQYLLIRNKDLHFSGSFETQNICLVNHREQITLELLIYWLSLVETVKLGAKKVRFDSGYSKYLFFYGTNFLDKLITSLRGASDSQYMFEKSSVIEMVLALSRFIGFVSSDYTLKDTADGDGNVKIVKVGSFKCP